jgi:NAD(P)H-flavin reductase
MMLYGAAGWLSGKMSTYNERLPFAQRWHFFPGSRKWTQITLIDRVKDHEDDTVEIFRFALPNSYDYAGYAPVMSVQLSTHNESSSEPAIRRWFTPISHPEERGVIEFAIKEADPGRFRTRIRDMRRGDVLFMGRWMKEFQYRPNEHDEIGIIASTGGVSVALQLLKYIEANSAVDHTKLTLLYCTAKEAAIPVRNILEGYVSRNPGQFNVEYNAVHRNAKIKHNVVNEIVDPVPAERLHFGFLGYETLSKVLPPPARPSVYYRKGGGRAVVGGDESGKKPNNKLLICVPEVMQSPLCGKVMRIGNATYFDTRMFGLRWHGLLPELGYSSSEAYRFGYSKQPVNLFY